MVPDSAKAHVLIAVFSVVRRHSFENVMYRIAESKNYIYPKAAIVLVGNQTDPRSHASLQNNACEKKQNYAITPEEGSNLARLIHAIKYLECFCKTGMGVRNLFREAVWTTLYPSATRMLTATQQDDSFAKDITDGETATLISDKSDINRFWYCCF